MAKQIFVNLPVKDLNKSKEFFTKLGFSFNLQFTNEEATCMIIAENIYAMLLVEKRFRDFTKKEIADATKTTEVLIAIDAESKEKVTEMVEQAKAAGGTIYMEPADHGWMYQHSFADLDGHQWEILFMDETLLPEDFNKQQPTDKTILTVDCLINASVEKVWNCWTAPEHIVNWNFASDDWCSPAATNDLRIGGRFNTRMESSDGTMGFDFEGTYQTVKVNEQIEYIMDDGRKATVLFIKKGETIQLIESFEAEAMNSVELQQQGWKAILDNFKKYVESN